MHQLLDPDVGQVNPTFNGGYFPVAPLRHRVWSKIDRTRGIEEDWPWLLNDGTPIERYPQVRVDGQIVRVMRLVYYWEHGYWPVGVTRHTCDWCACCNPLHLLDGTRLDNVLDQVERGRTRPGELTSWHRLTDQLVIDIRRQFAAGKGITVLARQHGVGWTTIRDVVRRETWRHIP